LLLVHSSFIVFSIITAFQQTQTGLLTALNFSLYLQLTTTLLLLSRYFDFCSGPEQQPEWYRVVLDNKMALFFGVYLINVFAQNAAQTGAFEIVHNGKTVFSKLQESRLPNIQEIVNGLSRNGLKTV
jgi:selT/selW/selH-like putative selenoprotein